MKNLGYIIVAMLMITFSACEVENIVDPNGPSAESFAQDATEAELQLLAAGLQAVQRIDMEFWIESVSIVGREYWDLNSVDPRYTSELLGKDGAQLDNNGFLTTRAYSAKHRAIRNAHVLITAATNGQVTSEQKSGYTGFAKTIIGYNMLLELVRQYENGIRLDVSDIDNLSGFSNGYQDGLTGVMGYLDAGLSDLNAAGDDFNFGLSPGFEGYDDPAGFAQFNRAIAARVALYQNDMSGAMSALNASFFDLNGDLDDGVYFSFSANANDQLNPVFYVPGAANDKYAIHPSFLNDAEPGDTRVSSKTTPWGQDVLVDGLTGNTQISLYSSDTDPVGMIRNEELILIYAEANMTSSPADAVVAINTIRTAAGLGPYVGGLDAASLEDEILHQRRYSLLGEGHRWVDMRRYNRLPDPGGMDPDPCPDCDVPTDREGDVVHVQFPRPIAESD